MPHSTMARPALASSAAATPSPAAPTLVNFLYVVSRSATHFLPLYMNEIFLATFTLLQLFEVDLAQKNE